MQEFSWQWPQVFFFFSDLMITLGVRIFMAMIPGLLLFCWFVDNTWCKDFHGDDPRLIIIIIWWLQAGGQYGNGRWVICRLWIMDDVDDLRLMIHPYCTPQSKRRWEFWEILTEAQWWWQFHPSGWLTMEMGSGCPRGKMKPLSGIIFILSINFSSSSSVGSSKSEPFLYIFYEFRLQFIYWHVLKIIFILPIFKVYGTSEMT